MLWRGAVAVKREQKIGELSSCPEILLLRDRNSTISIRSGSKAKCPGWHGVLPSALMILAIREALQLADVEQLHPIALRQLDETQYLELGEGFCPLRSLRREKARRKLTTRSVALRCPVVSMRSRVAASSLARA
jgi:hypothetical protein